MAIGDPAVRHLSGAYRSALGSGLLGVVASLFLIAFLTLAYLGPTGRDWGWLGTINDWLIAGQFLLLIPTAHAVRRLLPARRLLSVSTGVGMATMATAALLQLALVTGLLSYEVQVRLLLPVLIGCYWWVLVVSSAGHRGRVFSRAVTRSGLLIGLSWPAAVLLLGAGALLGSSLLLSAPDAGSGTLLLVPGLALAAISWLLLPVWTLLLAVTALQPYRSPTRGTVTTAPAAADPKAVR